LRLTRPTGVGGADQFTDEQGHRLVIEALTDDLADADPGRPAAGADLLGVGQVDLLQAARQVLRLPPPAVPLPPRLGRRVEDRFGGRRLDRRRWLLGVGQIQPVEQGRPFDPLAAPAEGDLDEAVDVGLLGLDLLAKIRHDTTEFGDDGVGVGQLLAERVDVVGRRHAGLNTARPVR
jgi:hypothetical protein